jgi:hypothetical protein
MRALLSSAVLLLVLHFSVPDAHAQRGTFGIGGQVGDPTGLTLKFGSGARSFDLAAGWDLDDYLYVQGHLLLRERRLPGSTSDLRYFYGPGLFLSVRDTGRNDDDVNFGISFNAGLSYYFDAFELFGQLTPRLQLVDDTDFDLGGAIGIRFYP